MIKAYTIIYTFLIMDFFSYSYKGISLSGQLSDKILFWVWLIMTIIITIRFIKRKWVKWNLGMIGLLIILSLIPMRIPFLMLTDFATHIDYERRIENYRLRDDRTIVFGPPGIKVVENKGIFEIEIDDMDFGETPNKYPRIQYVDEIYLLKEKDNLVFEFVIEGFSYRRNLGNHRSSILIELTEVVLNL